MAFQIFLLSTLFSMADMGPSMNYAGRFLQVEGNPLFLSSTFELADYKKGRKSYNYYKICKSGVCLIETCKFMKITTKYSIKRKEYGFDTLSQEDRWVIDRSMENFTIELDEVTDGWNETLDKLKQLLKEERVDMKWLCCCRYRNCMFDEENVNIDKEQKKILIKLKEEEKEQEKEDKAKKIEKLKKELAGLENDKSMPEEEKQMRRKEILDSLKKKEEPEEDEKEKIEERKKECGCSDAGYIIGITFGFMALLAFVILMIVVLVVVFYVRKKK